MEREGKLEDSNPELLSVQELTHLPQQTHPSLVIVFSNAVARQQGLEPRPSFLCDDYLNCRLKSP